jgi:phosphatidylserine/phosphatidylglycerophosphate/cardiolipin synthase-like enzyme
MSLTYSAETHQNMLARIPSVTGRDLDEWLQKVDEGPSLVRCEEKIDWLRREYGISHGYAKAIVHEHDLRRAARKLR